MRGGTFRFARARLLAGLAGLTALAAGCSSTADAGNATPPIPMGEPPVEYPADLYARKIGGTVELLLFVDSNGVVVPDSTRVNQTSGQRALDSAALAAAPKLQYSPATRNGRPIATSFLQPIHFRHPESTPDTTNR
jgi:protein TonB